MNLFIIKYYIDLYNSKSESQQLGNYPCKVSEIILSIENFNKTLQRVSVISLMTAHSVKLQITEFKVFNTIVRYTDYIDNDEIKIVVDFADESRDVYIEKFLTENEIIVKKLLE